MTPEMRAEVHAEYIESLQPYRREDGAYYVEGEFVYMLGRKP